MLFVEDYAVLVVINIGRVLQVVLLVAEHDGDDTVVLSCGMPHMSGIALVLTTQKAGGIA